MQAIVTGANKGIGLEIVKALCKQPGYRVVLCSRDLSRGLDAAAKLEAEGYTAEVAQVDITDPLRSACFPCPSPLGGPLCRVCASAWHHVTSPASLLAPYSILSSSHTPAAACPTWKRSLTTPTEACWMWCVHTPQLHCAAHRTTPFLISCVRRFTQLVNNAGFAYKGNLFGHKEAKETLSVNLGGTVEVTDRMMEYLRRSPDGRLINVCSQAGRLTQLTSDALKARFAAPDLSRDQLKALAAKFISDIEHDRYKAEGWSQSMYGISKMAEIAYTRVLIRENAVEAPNLFIAACCPGWCATDMSSHKGPRSAATGAAGIAFLASAGRADVRHADGRPRGWFWYDSEPLVGFQDDWGPPGLPSGAASAGAGAGAGAAGK